MKPQTLALLAVGGIFLMTQRKAAAATLATPYGGTPNTQRPSVANYYSTPAAAAQYASYAQGRSLIQQPSPIAEGFKFLTSLISTSSPGFAPGTYFPGALGTGQSASADGAIGERVAQDFALANPDAFTPSMPDFNAINAQPWAQAAIYDPTEY